MRDLIVVGIDPGVNTGFAIYSQEQKQLLKVESMAIHLAILEIRELHQLYGEKLFVRIEDPNTYIPYKNVQQSSSRLQGAGSIKRDCKIWVDLLDHQKIRYELVSLRSSLKKLTSETFKNYTKWKQKTNEHGRDAAMLAFDYK